MLPILFKWIQVKNIFRMENFLKAKLKFLAVSENVCGINVIQTNFLFTKVHYFKWKMKVLGNEIIKRKKLNLETNLNSILFFMLCKFEFITLDKLNLIHFERKTFYYFSFHKICLSVYFQKGSKKYNIKK